MTTHGEFYGHSLRTQKKLEFDAPCLLCFLQKCNEQSINSHTISKNCLTAIAHKGHVVTPTPVVATEKTNETTRFKQRGLKRSSTYRGFCSSHDDGLFKKIDQFEEKIDIDSICKYFLRSLGQEYQKKIKAFATLDSIKIFDSNFQDDTLHQYEIDGQKMGAQLLWKQFEEIYPAIENKDYSNFRFLIIEFDQLFPFAYLGSYSHELEFMEIELGDNNPTKCRASVMGFVPTKKGSTFFMGWHKEYTKFIPRFLNALATTRGAVPEFLFQYGMALTENIFLDPLWYHNIGKEKRGVTEAYFRDTTRAYPNYAHRPFAELFSNTVYKLKLETNAMKVRMWKKKNNFTNF